MALFVQKFGGSSLSDLSCIKRVANIIAKTRASGHEVVAVVSAMAGDTDHLLKLAHEAAPEPCAREADALLAAGEQISAALLSLCLIARQCPARSFVGPQMMIYTNSCHGKAKIQRVKTESLQKAVKTGYVPVVAGFQGISSETGCITTIGRGGSDLTAVALAAALKADECQIYTDVDGVYTSDPRVIQEARLLPKVTFPEMLELSALGAKVLQKTAVEFAFSHSVPLRVLSTFKEGQGTLVTVPDREQTGAIISGIAFDRNQAKLSIVGLPNYNHALSEVIKTIESANIEMDMIIQNVPSPGDLIDFSFTVSRDRYLHAKSITQAVAERLSAHTVLGEYKIAKLSVVGLGMKSHAGTASKILEALAMEGISIHLITSTENKISALVEEKYLELGARILHTAFNLDNEI